LRARYDCQGLGLDVLPTLSARADGNWITRVSPTPLLLIVARDDRLTAADLALPAYERALPARSSPLPASAAR